MKNQYGYVIYYKQRGSEKLKIYLVTNTYGSAEWNVRWYENHSPPDRKTGKPIENATWIIRPITTYREYKRRWRGCPFEPLIPKNKKITRRKQMKISVGDIVYQTDGTRLYRSKVKSIILGERIIYDTDSVAFDERAIGQSIFLTKEDAEARMKELQERL